MTLEEVSARNSVIEGEFRSGKTLAEIGGAHNLTRERVRQILKKRGVKAEDGGYFLQKMSKRHDEPKNKTALDLFRRHRSNVRSQGIPWHLSFSQWWKVWEESDHFHERGVHKGQYGMSLKNREGAYEEGNVIISCTSERQGRKPGPKRLDQLIARIEKLERAVNYLCPQLAID